MKKLLCITFTILLMIPVFGYFCNEEVEASGGYEVAYINDDGSFSTVDTYSDLSSATNKMKENEDYVVRHGNSRSPSKIIAMNSGLVYSYPYRRGYSTMNIYEKVNSSLVGSGVSTYVSEHYEMTYHSTYYYYESQGLGFVEVTLNGFHGYCDLEYTDLVPTKFIEKKISITLGGGDTTGSNEQPFKVKVKQNYYYVDEHDNYRDLIFVYHRAWSKDGGDCLEYKLNIGVAPDFMDADTRYYSNDGINFYNDRKLKDKAGIYYNYYQFLPLRTKTNISANTMNSFIAKNAPSTSIIKNEGQAFVNAQNEYGCNASTILCMAIHESGWGDSAIAKGKNNLFGWGAYDDATSNAARYSSVEACVSSQMADNLANYMDVHCSRYFSMSLGNKGGGFITQYASDPYWAEKIAAHYYSLDKYSGGGNGKLTDYNTYALALVNTTNASVKDKPNGSTLFKTANKSGYQKNLIVSPLEIVNGYAKINTSNPIYDGDVCYPIELKAGTLVSYDYKDSIGYISTSDLVMLSDVSEITSSTEPEVNPSKFKTMLYIDELTLKDNSDIISISGLGFIKGLSFIDQSKIKHELVFVDSNDENNIYTYDLLTFKDTTKLNDGFTYDYVGFKGNVDIADLENGDYITYLRVINGEYQRDILLSSSDEEMANVVSNSSDHTIRLATNKPYSYRYELSKLSSPIDFRNINKKRNVPSVFSYDSIEKIDDKTLEIQAMAFIPGVNFKDNNNVEFNVYLISSKNDFYKLDTTIVDNAFNYTKIYKTSYDLDNVTYKFDIDLSDLSGEYKLVTEIISNDGARYIDYVDMDNQANLELPTIITDSKEYRMIESLDHKTTILSCLDK